MPANTPAFLLSQSTDTQNKQANNIELGWVFENGQCESIPDESTEDYPSPADKLTPKSGQIKTPLMLKWNRVTQVGKDRGSQNTNLLNKYCMPAIAQAQPGNGEAYTDNENFSFFGYVSNRQYLKDNEWNSRDGYFQEMFKSLLFAKMATVSNQRGQVSPVTTQVQLNSRINCRSQSNKIIMLDLDETLIRAEPYVFGKTYNDIISVKVGYNQNQSFGVMVRPFTKEFMQIIARNHRLIVYTASIQEYAEKIVKVIDPNRQFIDQILSRQHCTFINGMFIKNLDIALQYGVKLEDVIIVDNYVHSYALHLEHGIPIKPFYGSKEDKELIELANVLHLTDDYTSLKDFMRSHFDFPQLYDFLNTNKAIFSN